MVRIVPWCVSHMKIDYVFQMSDVPLDWFSMMCQHFNTSLPRDTQSSAHTHTVTNMYTHTHTLIKRLRVNIVKEPRWKNGFVLTESNRGKGKERTNQSLTVIIVRNAWKGVSATAVYLRAKVKEDEKKSIEG